MSDPPSKDRKTSVSEPTEIAPLPYEERRKLFDLPEPAAPAGSTPPQAGGAPARTGEKPTFSAGGAPIVRGEYLELDTRDTGLQVPFDGKVVRTVRVRGRVAVALRLAAFAAVMTVLLFWGLRVVYRW